MKCNIHNSNICYSIWNTGIRTSTEHTEINQAPGIKSMSRLCFCPARLCLLWEVLIWTKFKYQYAKKSHFFEAGSLIKWLRILIKRNGHLLVINYQGKHWQKLEQNEQNWSHWSVFELEGTDVKLSIFHKLPFKLTFDLHPPTYRKNYWKNCQNMPIRFH